MSYFFTCEIDDAIQYINLEYEAQAPKRVILYCIFSSFCVVFKLYVILVISSFPCHIFKVYFITKSFFEVLLSFSVIYFFLIIILLW